MVKHLGFVALLALLLTACATAAQMQYMNLETSMKATSSSMQACLDNVKFSSDYSPIRENIPDDPVTPTMEQMNDTSKATATQAKALKTTFPQIQKCRQDFLQQLNSYAPSLSPALIESWQEGDKLKLALINRKITWGHYVLSNKDVVIAAMQKMDTEWRNLATRFDQAHYAEIQQRQRAAAAMQQYNQNQQIINNMNRPRTTNCYGAYNSVNCTTY